MGSRAGLRVHGLGETTTPYCRGLIITNTILGGSLLYL